MLFRSPTWSAGSVPAEKVCVPRGSSCLASAYAIWLRHALCVHTKATQGAAVPAAGADGAAFANAFELSMASFLSTALSQVDSIILTTYRHKSIHAGEKGVWPSLWQRPLW